MQAGRAKKKKKEEEEAKKKKKLAVRKQAGTESQSSVLCRKIDDIFWQDNLSVGWPQGKRAGKGEEEGIGKNHNRHEQSAKAQDTGLC